MHARVASGVFLALGFADLAVLNLLLAPRLAADEARSRAAEVAPCDMPRPAAEAPPAPVKVPPAAPATGHGTTPASVAGAPAPDRAAPDVLFGLQSERVTSVESVLALERVAYELRADPSRHLVLRGHADRLGTPIHNLSLSRRRAEAVRTFLVAHGAPTERIAVEAAGDGEPADPTDTPTAWAKNRRVQILWR